MSAKSLQQRIILTGDRPTGALHLGHYIGSLRNRVLLQNEQDATSGKHRYKQYVLIADMQALTDNAENPEVVSENLLNVAIDYLAVGIDPNISTIFVQSQIPELSELTMYFLNLLTLNQIERNPTVKEEIKQKNFENRLPVGFLIYPVSQAADILAFRADLVPVGADQIPMIEDTNAIARKFNLTYKSEVFPECEALVPREHGRLIGIDGKAKMSKSLGNAIYLKDEGDELWNKVRQMYTDPDHIKVEDPGKVEGNVVFTYLDAFAPTDKRSYVVAMQDHYKRGGLGDMKVKKFLFEILEAEFAEIHKRRREYAKDPAEVLRIVRKGTEKARATVQETMSAVKDAMGLNYFDTKY